MATPQEIQQILAEIQRQYDSLGQTNPFANFDTSNITDAEATIRQLESGLRDVRSRVQDIDRDMGGVVSAFQSTLDAIKKQTSSIGKSTKALSGLQSIAQKLLYDQQGITKLNEKQLKNLKEQAKQRYSDLQASKESLAIEIAELELQGDQSDAIIDRMIALEAVNEELVEESSNLAEINRQVDYRLKQEKNINESLGLGGAILGSMKGALDKLGMGGLADKLGFSEAQEEMRALAEEMEEGGELTGSFADKTKILKAGFSSMGGSLMKNLKDPLSIGLMLVGQLVDAFFKIDKMSGDLADNLGMSYGKANNMVSSMSSIADLTGDTHVSTQGLVESQLALSQALGTNAQLSGELLVDFTKLTHQAGYSVETLTQLSKITQGTGKSLQDNTAELLGQAKAYNIKNGLALNEKEIVAEVAKTGAATVLTFGKSAKALTENVMAAKKFGINLEQAEKLSSSLLDFQSSIENEMEAELLTGKQLNLEEARLLALKGQTGKAAAEVLKQVGSSAEFGEMNVLAQESLAKAVGMTKDELAQSLIEREALASAGMQDLSTQEAYNQMKKDGLSDAEIAVKLGNEQLANQMASESVQDKMTAATEKLKGVFVSLLSPIMEMIIPITDLLIPAIGMISVLLYPVTEAFKGLAGILTGNTEKLSGTAKVLGTIVGIMGTLVGLGQMALLYTTLQKAMQVSLNASQAAGYGTVAKTLALMGLQNVAIEYHNARQSGSNVLQAIGNALAQTKLGTLILQGVEFAKNIGQAAIRNIQDAFSVGLANTKLGIIISTGFQYAKNLAITTASFVLEQAKNALLIAQNVILTVGNAIKKSGLLASIAEMAMRAFSSLSAIPVIGPILGIAAAVGAAALGYSYYSKADDLMSPGYGKRVLSSPEGTFALNDKDTVVAGTDLDQDTGESSKSPSGASNPINLAPLIAQMSQMNATLNAILSKEGTITLDGTKVGTALSVSNSKLQ